MRIEAWMPQSGGGDAHVESEEFSVSRLLFNFDDPLLCRQLERFRCKYEAEFGPTDLTKRYTSTWPSTQQKWLLENHPKLYWDGLPPFVQAFIKEKMNLARKKGVLDDQPAEYLELYLRGKMSIDKSGPTR